MNIKFENCRNFFFLTRRPRAPKEMVIFKVRIVDNVEDIVVEWLMIGADRKDICFPLVMILERKKRKRRHLGTISKSNQGDRCPKLIFNNMLHHYHHTNPPCRSYDMATHETTHASLVILFRTFSTSINSIIL